MLLKTIRVDMLDNIFDLLPADFTVCLLLVWHAASSNCSVRGTTTTAFDASRVTTTRTTTPACGASRVTTTYVQENCDLLGHLGALSLVL